jgi:phage baseplate assembly protein W
MGSLVVKIDRPTAQRLKKRNSYSDIDILQSRNPRELEVPMAYDIDAVRVAIRNILMWRVGESVIRPQFGHRLKKSMYAQMNQFNKEEIASEVKRAIEENEPRADIRMIAVDRSEDDEQRNTLHVKVIYSVVGQDVGEQTEFVEEAVVQGR